MSDIYFFNLVTIMYSSSLKVPSLLYKDHPIPAGDFHEASALLHSRAFYSLRSSKALDPSELL